MRRIEIVGPSSILDNVLAAVQERGVLHIEEIPLAEYGEKGLLHRVALSDDRLRERRQLEELLEILDEAVGHVPESVLTNLESSPGYRKEYKRWDNEDVGSVGVAARSMHAKVRSFVRRRHNVADDLRALTSYEEVVSALAPLVETNQLDRNLEFVGIILDQKSRVGRELFKEEMRKLTNGLFEYYEAELSNRRIAALVGYPSSHAHQVRSFILEAGIGQMNVPRYLRDRPFEEALADLERDIDQLREKQRNLEEQSDRFYRDRAPSLLALQHVCRNRHSQYEALSTLATTRYTFILRGWVPVREVAGLDSHLAKVSDGRVVMRRLKVGRYERPPVLMQNPKPFKPFEPLLALFPPPRYGTVDPTISIALVFPPIFGLMLGDIGYGVILGILAALVPLIWRGSTMARKLAIVTGWCAFFTVVFGFLFGELFGELGNHLLGLEPIWQPRFTFEGTNKSQLLLDYMTIAIVIGFLHVIFGLILGVINYSRAGDRHLVVENLAKIFGIFMLLFFVGRLAQYLPPAFTYAGIGSGVAFLALMVYDIMHKPVFGAMLPLELLSTLGNILSYVRIMAIGLVSVVLAFLANMFGGMASSIVVAILIAAAVHALNMALGIIDPTIQGLRLHYVEFFSKFFMSGGTPYKPFRKVGGITV